MAYTLGTKCTKNLCKRTVLVQFIIENVVTCFFLRHSVHAKAVQILEMTKTETYYKSGMKTHTKLQCVSKKPDRDD